MEYFSLTSIIIYILIAIILVSIRQVNQYQRGVKFRLGRFVGVINPGWRIILPIFESIAKVDIRVKAVDVPNQEAITKDNISVGINAVIYYKVSDASKAILEVENFGYAISQLAQTTMRNIVGSVDLDTLLSERDRVSNQIKLIVDKLTDPWGIKVENVDLKDVELPQEMKRMIARQAEAEREKRAVITKAEGEVIASKDLAQAANTLSAAPGALHLRTLNTLNDMAADKSNTVVFAIPLEILKAFAGMDLGLLTKAFKKKK